jgi:tRNA(adenine34) deaminase
VQFAIKPQKISEENMKTHDFWMEKALRLARKAAERGEVPVGAVLVRGEQLISKASNRREQWHTPLGHAELIALQRASQKLEAWRLIDCTLYVTLEPCVMCAGALVQARVSRVIYGAHDPKGGGVQSLFQIGSDPRLNHRFELIGGVMEQECSQLLKDFFTLRRQKK